MIDGVYPSQFVQVQVMRNSHYRNLNNIINKRNDMKVSFLSPDFLKMSRRKKLNHDNWRSFTQNRNQQQRFKNNSKIYQNLKKISTSKSRYTFKTQPPTPNDPLLHHNYLYQCQRRYQRIQKNNQLIASRLIKAKAQLSHRKQQAQFRVNKLNVTRLQKFQRLKRLNRIVNRSLTQKFMNTSTSSNNSRISRVFPRNPQRQ